MPPPVPALLVPAVYIIDGISLTTTINGDGVHHIECNRCKEIILLTKTANITSLTCHQRGKPCQKAATRKGLPWVYHFTHSNPPVAQIDEVPPARDARQSIPEISVADYDVAELCPGVSVDWTPGSIWTTYPYHQHTGDNLGWNPIAFDPEDNHIFLQSSRCKIEVPPSGRKDRAVAPCLECQSLVNSAQFRAFKERASFAQAHTPWDRLTYQQLDAIARRMARELKALQIKLADAQKRIRSFQNKIDDHKRIVMLIANNEIVGLRRLTAAALRHGSSAYTIADLMERSISGLYCPQSGFTDRDLDIAFLVKSIGGPRLLYALQKSHGLVSESTLRRHRKIPLLLPAISAPSKVENDLNMATFLDPAIRPPPRKISGQIPGIVLMFDGVALDTRCRYCQRRNHVLGLCREHSGNVSTEVNSQEDIETIRKALFNEEDPSKKVCFGSDATVVAIAPYASEEGHHNPVPLILSPSDKTEKWNALKLWIEEFLCNYRLHEFGECLTGPMWSIASDGDAVYRRTKHEICSTTQLDPSSPLGKILGDLLGLNTFTSSECVVWTCDPKHIIKRFATLLRSKTGLMIEDTNITATDIIRHLSSLPGMTPEKAIELLDPGDKQNVPKAVSLIQHLLKLKQYPIPNDSQFHRQKRDHIERNPDIKKPHRRLNLKDVTGIDRVNVQSWEGNARVGDVDLRAVWEAGRDAANDVLEEYFGYTARFDSGLFSGEGRDLQRPNGDYVGVKSTVDDSRSEEENTNFHDDFLSNLPATDNSTPTIPPDSIPFQPVPTSEIIPDDEFSDAHLPVGETLEDLLSDNVDGSSEDNEAPAFLKTLEIDGKLYHKTSLVASLTSNRAKKVTMRPLRAAGMAIEDLRQKSRFPDLGEDSAAENEPVMKSTDLGAFLTRCSGQICLAIVEIAGFRSEKGKSDTRSVESLEKIADSKSGIVIIGQVIQIIQSTSKPGRWEWNGRHLSLNSNSVDKRLLKSLYVAEIPSYIVQPIRQYATSQLDNEVTWSMEGSELRDALNSLWESLNPDHSEILSNLDILPEIKNPDALPYRTTAGTPSFYIENLPLHLIPKAKFGSTDRVACRLCNGAIAINKMRAHVGQHILRYMRGVEEPGLICMIEIEPCGFCGLEGCLTELKRKADGARSITIASNCDYHYEKLQYRSAMTFSRSSPCTNVPIHCPLCPLSLSGNPHTVWKYNVVNHLLTHHATVDPAQPRKYLAPEIPGQLLIDMFITKDEEKQMCIAEAATDLWRAENQIPNSDGLEQAINDQEHYKRERSGTMASSRSTGKKRLKKR